MYGDVNDLHVPLVVAAWRNIMNGDAPFWSAATFAGQNMLGSGQSAIFYPVNVLFGVFDPVTAYRWWLLTHIWVAAASSFAWAWWRCRTLPGAVAGYPLRSDLWEAGWTDDVLRVSTLVIPTSTSSTEPTARRVARA